MWEPHASYGSLSRDLILHMRPLYKEAFPHFHEVDREMQVGFFRHIAAMVYSCLFDVNEGNWFIEFITGLNEDEKANWARQVEVGMRGAPDERKSLLWHRWMKNYWEDRLRGRPCSLLQKEAEEMLEWAFVIGDSFPDAVALVIRGPRPEQCLGDVLHILETHDAPEKHPEAVLRLLDWLLQDPGDRWMNSKHIELVMFRLPKKKSYLRILNSICQHLASLGYVGAADLKRRVEQEFKEE